MPYIRKLFHEDKGFTLIELMVVLIILGIILAIAGPQYAKIQDKAEYDADCAIIESLARSAEMYAAKNDDYTPKKLSALITLGGIQKVKLKRCDNKDLDVILTEKGLTNLVFEFDPDIGFVTNLDDVIEALIGVTPY